MALNITTLASRWGKQIGGLNEAMTYGGTTVGARADTIFAQHTSLSAQAEVVEGLYNRAITVRSEVAAWGQFLAEMVLRELDTLSRDDTARPESSAIPDLFEKLNRDMASQSETFARPTMTATVAAANSTGGSNIGDGYLIASNIEPIDGVTCYYATAEVIRVICQADSYENQGTEGSEPFLASGETAAEPLTYLWPKGSGASLAIDAVSPVTAGILSGGRLDDSDWTGTSLTDWTAVGGTFGSAANGVISKSTTSSYTPNEDGDAFALMTGDGSLALGIYQVLDQEIVKANTNYGFQFWIKASSGTGTTTLSVALRDGSAAAISDNASSSQVVSVTDTTVNSSNGTWTRVSGVLRTPKNLPSELRFDIRTATAALAAARTLGIDHITLVELTPAYIGGPYIGICSGATPFARNDGFTVTVANDKTGTNFVRALDRIFDLKTLGIRLQTTTGTATQLDSLIS